MQKRIVPDSFLARLKAYDKHLDIEHLGQGRMAIIDTSAPVGRRRKRSSILLTLPQTYYARVLFIEPGQPLNGFIFEELRRYRLGTWESKTDRRNRLIGKVKGSEDKREKNKREMITDLAKEGWGPIIGRKHFIMPKGMKDIAGGRDESNLQTNN